MKIKKNQKRPLLVVKGRPVRYKKDFHMGGGYARGDITFVGGMGADMRQEDPFMVTFVTPYNFYAEIATKQEHVSREIRPSGRVVWCISDYDDWVASRMDPVPTTPRQLRTL